MFYGPMRETRDVIPVEGTTVTVEAFKRMLECFYHVDIDCSEMTIKELFGIVNLAEKYNVDKLKEEMKQQMEIVSIPIYIYNPPPPPSPQPKRDGEQKIKGPWPI